MAEPSLVELLRGSSPDVAGARDFFNDHLLTEGVKHVNEQFSPQQLAKQGRASEPLPTAKRQLSSYRTRMGTILEYALSTAVHDALVRRYGGDLVLTFASAHEYPDFYLRDGQLNVKLRVEMKSVDADSDEQAARFDVPTVEIDPARDLVVFVAWEWKPSPSGTVVGERPFIFARLAALCSELAAERDRRLLDLGGRIEGKRVLVPSKKTPGQMVPDPGNYGKLWRIIRSQRRGASHTSDDVRRFEEFLRALDTRTLARGMRSKSRFSSV